MKYLITADLHLTDHPDDDYRWELFEWLHKQIRTHNPDALLILGDITDRKDKHSSRLVNRLVVELARLGPLLEVFVLAGNHDAIDPTLPFFKFIDPTIPNIAFITEPELINIGSDAVLFVPHTRNPEQAWHGLDFSDPSLAYIFLHHTITGAIASNGSKMEGLDADVFKKAHARVYSGDIHVPQTTKGVTYVGSPYHVHFGDNFTPRVLLLTDGQERDLHFPSISKRTIEINSVRELEQLKLKSTDHVKIRLKLPKAEFCDWQNHKTAIEDLCNQSGIKLHSIQLLEKTRKKLTESAPTVKPMENLSQPELFRLFCEKEGIDDQLAGIGSAFL